MDVFKRKLKEIFYSYSTDDHYAEYNPSQTPSFHMKARQNDRVVGDEEMYSGEDAGEIGMDGYVDSTNNEGVSEVVLAWRLIDSWTGEHNPDLNATLGDPVTVNDITLAEEDLAVTLPSCVRASMRIHDGQEDLESMTGTSGLIYGLVLMPLDQVAAMAQAWRNVAKNLEQKKTHKSPASASGSATTSTTAARQFKLPNIPEQKSVPEDCIQPVYAHPAWIPLVTDLAGNHIGVDLAPGPKGRYAQVIAFGRDFDTKYVIANNWGDFLLSFANDLEAGNWYLIDDTDDYLNGDGELVFRDKKSNGPVQEYFEVLKRRTMDKLVKTQNAITEPQQEESLDKMADDLNLDSIVTDDEEEQEPDESVVVTETQKEPIEPVEEQNANTEASEENMMGSTEQAQPNPAMQEESARSIEPTETTESTESLEDDDSKKTSADVATVEQEFQSVAL